MTRVRIIVSHFANCEVNSSYCDWKVVNHTKNAKQFFLQEKFNSSGSYFSTLYPYFTHPLHAIINRNIAYTQNYIAKCKKCFAILKKNLRLRRATSLTTLGIFIAKWISKDNSNSDSHDMHWRWLSTIEHCS